MAKVKILSEGFASNAEKLLQDFAKCNSLEFDAFNFFWKKHNFDFIFRGKPTNGELVEFINESYKITLQYFDSSILEKGVGAIYLLYALFINQDLVPPIYIRITESQFTFLLIVLVTAKTSKIGTLHYVIDHLLNNCVEYVPFTSLFGPLTIKGDKLPDEIDYDSDATVSDSTVCDSTDSDSTVCDSTDSEQDLITLHETNSVDEIKDTHIQFQELSKSINFEPEEPIPDISGNVNDFKNNLECLINRKEYTETLPITSDIEIGCNRKKLKEAQCKRKVIGKYVNHIEDTHEVVDEPSTSNSEKVRKHAARKSPEKRILGRPKKSPEVSRKRSEARKKPYHIEDVDEPSLSNSEKVRNHTARKSHEKRILGRTKKSPEVSPKRSEARKKPHHIEDVDEPSPSNLVKVRNNTARKSPEKRILGRPKKSRGFTKKI